MLNEFKSFIAKGNVMDMAVGIIIGAAFTAIVGSLVADIVNPLIGIFMGGVDFAGLSASVGDAEFTYGNFIMAIINFLIIAFVVFMLVRSLNKMKKVEEEVVVAPGPAGPTQEELLAEILAALKK
jgi:large conductance mechanosensitive channel